MVTVTSVSALQSAVVRAERQVQNGETRVNQDTARLDQSQNQLSRDRETLAQSQRESTAARPAPSPAPAINLNRAIERPARSEQTLPAELTASRPQVNSLGQTIGKFINVAA
ncbi:MAG: hypothetical protein ABW069_03625 [Duganella sp.]